MNTPSARSSPKPSARINPVRIIVSLLPFLFSIVILAWGFFFIRDLQLNKSTLPQLVIVIFAIIWGVGGVILLFTTANIFVEQLPILWTQRLQPFVFIGPAVMMLTWALVIPTIRTIISSFYDEASVKFVGFKNFAFVFSDPGMLTVFRNNFLWVVVGTTFTVSAGLLIAVLADRSNFETAAKAFIFMPMAISFVGAGVIWNFVYAAKPVTEPQIGLLNSIVVSLGGQPQAWTAFFQPWNNFFLIVIVIWLQTGYAMVLLSAAVKGIPAEMLEAARVDGATEIQIFFRIMIPQILGSIIAVSTTIFIFSLKIFDVVWVMTGGQYGTSVIATEFYRQYFTYNNNGIGSAIAVVLFIAVIPVMIYNLRQFARREAFK